MDKLYSLEQLDSFLADPDDFEIGGNLSLAKQLANTMRENDRLREALQWCAAHPYAGGKSFGDINLVRKALSSKDSDNG